MSAVTPPSVFVFELLASDHRQQILNALRTRNEPVSEHDLVVLTAERLDESWSQPSSHEEYERLRIDQYHVHLPKLADAGLIRWNKEQQHITKANGSPSYTEIVSAAHELAERPEENGVNE